jgi:hypothetical protein
VSGNTLKTILGIGLIGASFLIPGLGPVLSTSLLFAGTSLAAAGLRPNLAGKQEGVLRNDPSTQASIPIIYGEALVGLRPADFIVVSNNNNLLFIVGALCHGSEDGLGIDSIRDIFADDRLLFTAAGAITAPFAGLFGILPAATVAKYLGTHTQVVDPNLHTAFPNAWPSSSRGRGIAYVVLFLRYNEKIWVNGIPNFTVKVRGRRVYDPRNGTTAWSTNPALCIRDYLLSTICGCAAEPTEIDEQSFIDGANYCDEVIVKYVDAGLVNVNGKRFECNGWLDTGNKVTENLQQLLSTCRGEIAYTGGKFSLIIRKATTVTGFKLTRENTMGVLKASLPGTDAMPNVMEATFVNPAKRYQTDTVQTPDVYEGNPFLLADNNFKTVAQIQLPLTNDEYTCRQIMQVLLKERRLGKLVVVGAKESILTQSVGDLIEVTNDTLAWVDQKCWIFSLGIAMDGTVAAGLQTYDPTMYAADQQVITPPPPQPAPAAPIDLRIPVSPIHGCVAVTGDASHPATVQLTNPIDSGVYMVVYELRRSQVGDANTRQAFEYFVGLFVVAGGSTTTGFLERRDQRDTSAIKASLLGYNGADPFDNRASFYLGLTPQAGGTGVKGLGGFTPVHPDSFPIILPPGGSLIGRSNNNASTLIVAACFDELLPEQLQISDGLTPVLGDPTVPRACCHGVVFTGGTVSSSGAVQFLNPIDSGRIMMVRELLADTVVSGSTVRMIGTRTFGSGFFTVNGVGWAGATLPPGRAARRDARSILGARGVLQGTDLVQPEPLITKGWFNDVVPDSGPSDVPEGLIVIDPGSYPIVLLPGEAILFVKGIAGGTTIKLYAVWDEFDADIIQIFGGLVPVISPPSSGGGAAVATVSPIHVIPAEPSRRPARRRPAKKG